MSFFYPQLANNKPTQLINHKSTNKKEMKITDLQRLQQFCKETDWFLPEGTIKSTRHLIQIRFLSNALDIRLSPHTTPGDELSIFECFGWLVNNYDTQIRNI